MVDKQSQKSKLQQMQNRITELEQADGYKQMQIDFYQKYLEIASEYVETEGSLSTKKPFPGR